MNTTVIARPAKSRADEAYAPESSWIRSSPSNFTRRAQAEITRMSNSRMALAIDPVHGLKELITGRKKSGRRPVK